MACMLDGRCPGDKLHLVPERFSCAGWRDDLPALFQNVPSLQSFMWQESMMLVFNHVQGAMRMWRAGSSGDEQDLEAARLAGTAVTLLLLEPVTVRGTQGVMGCSQCPTGPAFHGLLVLPAQLGLTV